MIGVIASEWLKLRSLRSNLYLLAVSVLAVGLCAGIAFMITRGFDRQTFEERLAFPSNGDGLTNGLPVAYFVFGAIGALAITSEHSTGMIRTSLVAVPRRQLLLFAKIPGLGAVALVAGQLLAFAMYAAGQVVLGDRAGQILLDGRTLGTSLADPGVAVAVVVAGLTLPVVTVIGLGVGSAVRSTPGALVVLAVILIVHPFAAMTVPGPLRYRLGSYAIQNLPAQIAGTGGGLLSPAAALAVLALYAVVALTAGSLGIARKGRRLAVASAGAAVAVLLAAVPATADRPAGHASLAWSPCRDGDGPRELECASVAVPLDWAAPSGRKITLRVARLPYTGAGRRIGTVFAIPGGPGGSGVGDLKRHAGSFTRLRDRFDVVSLDPRNTTDRGAGPQVLSLSCLASGPWLFQPRDRGEYAELARTNRAAAQRCRATDPEFFDHMDSASVARDIEEIRRALGEDSLSFLATSYGAEPAIAYARLFPARIRATVIDGSAAQLVDRSLRDRIRAATLEGQLTRFAAWCDSTTSCALHGRDVRALWRGLVTRADTSPVPVRGEPSVSYSGLDLKVAAAPSFISPGQEPAYPRWTQLAEAIKDAVDGDASGFAGYVREATGSPKVPAFVGMNMTHCLDGVGYASYDEYTAARRADERLSPDFAGNQQWHPLACAGWPAPVANPPAPLPATGLPPFLGVGSRTDHADTEQLVRQVPGSSSVRWDGYGHGLYLSGVPCVTAYVNRYLTTLRLPPAGTVCRPTG
ncbi:alpha/beta fold hydrolase [Sphaerisporangium fuscum]|uniref:alpha/beta fold hydrolase n=1 Tax=Sphaerisporangium fuscum TaxID=2835868 RepID=UPI001BDBD6CD|nr:alpha/beta fold hydrolase [Sphaerisporangium fuscum]